MYKTLVVEDNFIFRKTLLGLLNQKFSDMKVESASDGRIALEKYFTFFPHLVLMDIRLPGENGLELTRKIRMDNKDVIIVILTSHDGPEYRLEANRNGANFFISKSNTSSQEIVDLIESIAGPELLVFKE